MMVALPGALSQWKVGPGPLYSRLAGALRLAIERGDVIAGFRLPAERILAQELGVSRTTVVTAYDTLRAEDLLESRQGSGTWVRGSSRPRQPASSYTGLLLKGSHTPLVSDTRSLAPEPESHIDFLGACLPALPGTIEAASAVAAEDLPRLSGGTGYAPMGLPSLREAITRHLDGIGLPTRPEQILVTNGAQQAISLLATLFVQRGDQVILEDPTYMGAIDVFSTLGAQALSARVGPDGVDVDAVEDIVRRKLPRLIYLMPTFHNPTGTLLPYEQRLRLARLAQEAQLPLIEDDTLAELPLGGQPPPPIAALLPAAPVITVGSMSKLFWGGLRIGWIRADEATIGRLTSLKVSHDLGGSILSQAVAVRLLERAQEIKEQRRTEARNRFEVLAALLRQHLPEWQWREPAGGLSIWIRLPAGQAHEFAQMASRHGVSVVPGPINSADGNWPDHIRLVYVQDEPALREGVERLARAWRSFSPTAPRNRRSLGVLV